MVGGWMVDGGKVDGGCGVVGRRMVIYCEMVYVQWWMLGSWMVDAGF